MKIDKNKFKVEYTRGTGAGGQHRNKVETCVVITHIETGLSEKCEDTRKRNLNEKTAYTRLLNRLKKMKADALHEKLNEKRNKAISEAGIIRTYNFQRNEVKDHRTSKKATLKEMLAGKIDLLK
jgi:peptide chain release factor 1